MTLTPILLFSVPFCAVVLAVLMVFGQEEDKGFSIAQKVIRSWFRLSRWTYAQAKGWDEFLVHYRRGCSARRTAVYLAMKEPLPELSTPRSADEFSEMAAKEYPC